jgi:hypothetical protein
MRASDDGGPAFPGGRVTDKRSNSYQMPYWDGMALRDWFAGRAIPAAVMVNPGAFRGGGYIGDQEAMQIAVNAYAIADAMLEARKAE